MLICFGCLVALFLLLLLAAASSGLTESGVIVTLLMLAGILIWSPFVIRRVKRNEAERQQKEEKEESAFQNVLSNYQRCLSKIILPSTDIYSVEILSSGAINELHPAGKYICWREKSVLHFFQEAPNRTNYHRFSNATDFGFTTTLDDIIMFSREGEFFREQKITGGGANVAGAIVGGVLGGTAGAIVGGRESISSHLIEHDTRHVGLWLKVASQERVLTFSKESFGVFNWLIPEKEQTLLEEDRRKKILEASLHHLPTWTPPVQHLPGNHSTGWSGNTYAQSVQRVEPLVQFNTNQAINIASGATSLYGDQELPTDL